MELALRLELWSEPAPSREKLPGWMLFEIGKGAWWQKKPEKKAPRLVEMWCDGVRCWVWNEGSVN